MNLPRTSRTSQRPTDREQALVRALASGLWDDAARLMSLGRAYSSPFALREALIAEWIRLGRGVRA